ncbi:BRR2A [Symbiodinium sp. CCMP2592]|nr:BRR2A [Symbiodinium sp. CCMP2592]
MFFAVLFVVPFSIVCCCLRGSNISSNGVCGETLKVFHSCIDIEVADQDMPGLFAASVESRRQICADLSPMLEVMIRRNPEPMKPGSVVQFVQATGSGEEFWPYLAVRALLQNLLQVWPVTGPPKSAAEVQTKVFPQSVLAAAEPRISCPFSDPAIRRGTAVLWAHMWRLHPHMPPAVQAELTGRLMHLPKLGRAMTSVAAHGEGDRSGFVDIVRSSIKFQRCLVQAMDFDDSPLLQLPHVRSVPANPPTLREDHLKLRLLKSQVVESCGEPSLLRRIGNFSTEQVLDIQAFCRHAPLVELSYVVNDEPDMAEGDLGTLKITLTRTNLDATESVGAVHAPLFPGVKFEEWWLLVYDNRGRRTITAPLQCQAMPRCSQS